MKHWKKHRIGDLVEILSGFAFDSEKFSNEGELPIVRIRDVVRGHSTTFYNGEYDDKYLLSDGDMLIGMDGEFNLARWQGGPAVLNQRVCRISASNVLLNDGYLFRFLPAALKAIEDVTPYVTVKHLSVKSIREIEITLPPLTEQLRIAAVLDQAEALRAKRRAALAQLDSLTQAIFLEMFGDPVTNPKGWPAIKLGDVVFSASDGPHVSPEYVESGIPFLSTRHVRTGGMSWEDLKFISPEEAQIHWRKCKPERGDILYTKGGTTGIAKVVDWDKPVAIWVHIALLKTDKSKVEPLWLEAMLNAPFCYKQSQRLTRGIANRDLGLTRMVTIKMYLPPFPLQREFARRVTAVEKLKTAHHASLAELEALFAALQHRAFRGEL